MLEPIIDEIVQRISEKLKESLEQRTDQIMDVDGLCKYLSVQRKWVLQRTCKNEIPCYRLSGKELRFRQSEIDAWLKACREPDNPFHGKFPARKKS